MTAPGVTAELEPTRNDLVEIGALQYGDQEYRLTVGRDPELVEQIVAGAREEFMQRMVPKDERQRFRDAESFEEWYAKGRFLVALRDSENNLAGIVWFGPSSLDKEIDSLQEKSTKTGIGLNLTFYTIDGGRPEGCEDTFAIRIYEKHRDQQRPASEEMSFARRFMQKGQFLYENSRAGAGSPVDRIWLETNLYEYDSTGRPSPNGAVYLYEKAGFNYVGTYTNPDLDNPEERVIMATDPYAERSIGEVVLAGTRTAA